MGLNSFLKVTVMGQDAKLPANAPPSAGPGQAVLLMTAASVSGWATVCRTLSRLRYRHSAFRTNKNMVRDECSVSLKAENRSHWASGRGCGRCAQLLEGPPGTWQMGQSVF